MEKKILKSQLYSLFVLTTLNLIYFYYREHLPDHYFEISYQNSYINFFTYYLVTLLANFGYWCGIWVTLAFGIFALLHSLVLTKNKEVKHQFVIVALLPFIICVSYLLVPESLGEGLASFIQENLSLVTVWFSVLFFGMSFFYLVSEKNFFKCMKYIWNRLKTIQDINLDAHVARLKGFYLGLESKFRSWSIKENKEKQEKPEPRQFLNRAAPESILPKNINPEISVENDISDEDEVDEVLEEDAVGDTEEEMIDDAQIDASEEELEDGSPASPSINHNFFESEELVNCLVSNNYPNQTHDPDDGYFSTIAKAIQVKLQEFNINAEVINVLKGPVVDTFELELGAGVKVSGVINRTDDLSLALKGAPIRMVYPMKGKTTIGIEVPRDPRDLIYLDEVLSSQQFKSTSHRLPIAMGKDAYGNPAFIDLASTPHFLVAGTTGSGKSVFINTLLVSLIIKLSPKQLRLIMIDPKQLELALYQKLPHLIMPVVTDSQIASIALLWAIDEMERRYSILKDFAVKNIEGFNKKVKNCELELRAKISKYYPDVDSKDFEMPYIVIVVDEFADLKLSKSGSAIETSISRLAAKARASGIHIVLATQRPSTDVITGVIKANFPTRVAFRVTTQMDSRVILDTQGAEKLLGKGDMLYKQGYETVRMHSGYVGENEIERLVEKLTTIPAEYDAGAMEFIENNQTPEGEEADLSNEDGSGAKDEKYEEAVRCVAMHRTASTSFLQRRLSVGYNRAANLIDEMERRGVVGPAQGAKQRKVLIPPPSDSTP